MSVTCATGLFSIKFPAVKSRRLRQTSSSGPGFLSKLTKKNVFCSSVSGVELMRRVTLSSSGLGITSIVHYLVQRNWLNSIPRHLIPFTCHICTGYIPYTAVYTSLNLETYGNNMGAGLTKPVTHNKDNLKPAATIVPPFAASTHGLCGLSLMWKNRTSSAHRMVRSLLVFMC